MLSVIPNATAPPCGIGLEKFAVRALSSGGVEHVCLMIEGEIFRLDIIEGKLAGLSGRLSYVLDRDWRLLKQLETICRFEKRLSGNRCVPNATDGWISRRMVALQAWDARTAGASLREIAIRMSGPGEWPGPGECRKSAARRLIAMGDRLIREGPWPILAR